MEEGKERSHPWILFLPFRDCSVAILLSLSSWKGPNENYGFVYWETHNALQFSSILLSQHFQYALSNDQFSYNLSASILSLTILPKTDFADSRKRFFQKTWKRTSNFLPLSTSFSYLIADGWGGTRSEQLRPAHRWYICECWPIVSSPAHLPMHTLRISNLIMITSKRSKELWDTTQEVLHPSTDKIIKTTSAE